MEEYRYVLFNAVFIRFVPILLVNTYRLLLNETTLFNGYVVVDRYVPPQFMAVETVLVRLVMRS